MSEERTKLNQVTGSESVEADESPFEKWRQAAIEADELWKKARAAETREKQLRHELHQSQNVEGENKEERRSFSS